MTLMKNKLFFFIQVGAFKNNNDWQKYDNLNSSGLVNFVIKGPWYEYNQFKPCNPLYVDNHLTDNVMIVNAASKSIVREFSTNQFKYICQFSKSYFFY